MYADFVHRVHRCRTNPEVSKQIQDCCAYIELHAEEEIPIDQLAKRFGYAEYYLTKKFKREMHTSLTNYIKYVRIERAKLLLTTTGLSLQEIADRLHFCSRSYFGKIFHEVVAARRWNIARSNKSFCLHYSAHRPVLNNNKIVTNVKNSSCFPNKANF